MFEEETYKPYMRNNLRHFVISIAETTGLSLEIIRLECISELAQLNLSEIRPPQTPKKYVAEKGETMNDSQDSGSSVLLQKRVPKTIVSDFQTTMDTRQKGTKNTTRSEPIRSEAECYIKHLDTTKGIGYAAVSKEAEDLIRKHSISFYTIDKIRQKLDQDADTLADLANKSETYSGTRGDYEKESLVLLRKQTMLPFEMNTDMLLSSKRFCGTPDAISCVEDDQVPAEFKSTRHASTSKDYNVVVCKARQQLMFYMYIMRAPFGYVVIKSADTHQIIKVTAEESKSHIATFTKKADYYFKTRDFIDSDIEY